MIKNILLTFFSIAISFFLRGQAPNFIITPAIQCASTSNTATIEYLPNAPAATTYSWVITSPSPGCNPTFTPQIGGVPSNSFITITFPCCGVFTIASQMFSNSIIMGTIINTATVICYSTTETITISNSLANTTVCPGTSATLTASGGASYYWPLLNSTSPTVVVNPTVSTCYKAVGTNTQGCGANATTCLSIVAAPAPIISGIPQICTGQSTTLTASGVSSYTWGNGSNTSSLVVSPTLTTTYTLTGNNGCANATSHFTLNVDPTPTVTIASSAFTLCPNNSATLVASGANNYTWSNGANSNSIVITPSASTIYSVDGSDANCSDSSSPLTITVVPNPTILVAASQTLVCPNTPVILIASGATTYSWHAGAVTSSYTVNPGANSTYTVSGTHLSCTTNKTFSIQVYPNPSVTISGPGLICSGENASLSASGAASYSWSNQSSSSSISVSPLTTTVYTVNGTDLNGCSGTASYTVNINSCLSIFPSFNSETLFSLYPNPSTSALIIESSSSMEVTFSIYDLSGRPLTKGEFSHSIQLDVSDLNAGTYIIHLQSGTSTAYKKLVIE